MQIMFKVVDFSAILVSITF